jgi:hypothetical protein
MVEVSLKRLFYAAPPLVGVAGYDLYGLLLGVALSAVLYVVRPRPLQSLAVRPPLPVEPELVVELPEGAEPCAEALKLYNRWSRECKQNCGACSYYQPGHGIPCALLEVMRATLPVGDPFTQSVEVLIAEVRVMLAAIQRNNALRQREEIRRIPWIQIGLVALNAIVYFGMLQLLNYVLAAL